MDQQISNELTEEKVYNLAITRLNLKQNFIRQVITYIVVNAFLFMLDFMFSDGTWFYYVLGIWGIILISRGIKTYSSLKFTLTTKAIEREIERLK
ncbi:2TM domain-containing protein [Haloplasma contractile]|uniref:2TM domain protein n=1 Tax=Haloplasma contractile SSD-17B TaxID=1033810 RepID=U2FJK4_9MOLU|nr:2TM domain-containing protein [Haloplasma contractile]ERJ11439.1 2TM domain protein [Haloplasma contractile SSD-17B]